MIAGGCHCGTVRYEVKGEAQMRALCHCGDCRRHAGAPMMAWAMYPEAAVKVTMGTLKIYASSDHGRRHFCPECGTNLLYTNAVILPGLIDIQIATLDDPQALSPQKQVQTAERIEWMAHVHELPEFERYPA
jgi:hypothetical protein